MCESMLFLFISLHGLLECDKFWRCSWWRVWVGELVAHVLVILLSLLVEIFNDEGYFTRMRVVAVGDIVCEVV